MDSKYNHQFKYSEFSVFCSIEKNVLALKLQGEYSCGENILWVI